MLIALFSATSFSVSAKKNTIDEAKRDARKSDYIFLEALKYKADDADDAYYSLIEAAYLLNPSDLYLSKEYGMKQLYESPNDSLVQLDTFNRFRKFLDDNPNDFYEALEFVWLTNTLGHRELTLNTLSDLHRRYPERVEISGYYADKLASTLKNDSIAKAISIYDEIETVEGITPNTIGRKISLYHMISDTAAVKAQAIRLVDSKPRSAEYATIASTIYSKMGDVDSARVLLDQALAIEPDYGPAHLQMALFFLETGDNEGFVNKVKSAVRTPEIDFATKFELLRNLIISNSEDNAVPVEEIDSLFDELVDQYPAEPQGLFLYADYLATDGRYAPAAKQVEAALELDPSDPKRWQMLGSLYYTIKDYDKAIATTEDALKFFPDNPDLYNLGSSAFIQKKDYNGAVNILTRGLEATDSTLLENRSQIISAIADAYYAKGEPDSAFIYYNQALELDPDNLLALNNCAYHLACKEMDLDKALSMIERVVKENPESVTSLDTYAWVLFKMKNYEKAREVIDGALANEEEAGSAEVLEHAGDIYFMTGDPDRAVDFWKKALELNPDADNDLLQRKVKNKTYFYK